MTESNTLEEVQKHLTLDNVFKHWQEHGGSHINRLLDEMSKREYWTAVPEEIKTKILDHLIGFIVAATDQQKAESMTELESAHSLSRLFTYLNMPSFLRAIQLLENNQEGFASRLIMTLSMEQDDLQATPYSSLYFERLAVIQRVDLASKVFMPNRARRIKEDLKLILGAN